MKTAELYNELKQYPNLITERTEAEIEAVLSHSHAVLESLADRLKHTRAPNLLDVNGCLSTDWLKWYEQLPDESKAPKFSEPATYLDVTDDLDFMSFYVFPNKLKQFPMLEPLYRGKAEWVYYYLQENEGTLLITQAFDQEYLKLFKKIIWEKEFIQELQNRKRSEPITRQKIIDYAKALKENGYRVQQMFDKTIEWLSNEKYPLTRVKEEFGFSIESPESFNRFLNKN